jgi:hypothetical protein
MLPVSADASLNTLSTVLLSDISSEEVTFFRLLKSSLVPKKRENVQFSKGQLFIFIAEEANIF